jgi:hypothetical protein
MEMRQAKQERSQGTRNGDCTSERSWHGMVFQAFAFQSKEREERLLLAKHHIVALAIGASHDEKDEVITERSQCTLTDVRERKLLCRKWLTSLELAVVF